MNTIGGIMGGAAIASETSQRPEPNAPASGARASNLRTLRDQHDGEDHHELYNGNTVSHGAIVFVAL